jgi:hypothetical protein
MIRQPEREQLNRLSVKTLDQVFIMRAKEGLGCSHFEAKAPTIRRQRGPLARGPLFADHNVVGVDNLQRSRERCPLLEGYCPGLKGLLSFV